MFPERIAKEDVRELPLLRFEGPIHLIDTEEELEKVLRKLNKEDIVGFDTETKPTFSKGEYNPTALIQLSTLREAFVIRIRDIGIPNTLKQFLESSGNVKVGISIRDDLNELRKIRNFHPAGFIELNNVASTLGIKQIGVKSLAGIFLKCRISKNQQTSNWELKELSTSQLVYAATDAWICIKMYSMLISKGFVDPEDTY